MNFNSPYNSISSAQIVLSIALWAMLLSINNLHAQKLDSVANKLTADIEREYLKGHINGFSVAIVNHETTLYNKGFGFADKRINRLYTKNTIQNVSSISKTFIGVALLKAEEQGLLNLDDPISKYLPFSIRNPEYPGDDITIRHLATHTSTITDCPKYWQKTFIYNDSLSSEKAHSKRNFNASKKMQPMSQMFWDLLHKKGTWYSKENYTENRPGEVFVYSNTGAALAAFVLELATETDFKEFCKLHIFDPLNMTQTGWHYSDVDMYTHARLYKDPGTELVYYHSITYPDGGLITSSADLALFLSELIKGYNGVGTILDSESYQKLYTAQLSAVNFIERKETSRFDKSFNTGIFIGQYKNGTIGHEGGSPGVAAYMFFNPENMLGRIIIANTTLDLEGSREYLAIWNKLAAQEEVLNKLHRPLEDRTESMMSKDLPPQ